MRVKFTIEVLKDADDEAVEAFARLIPLLSTGAAVPDAERVAAVLGHPANTVIAARARERIVGLLTLVVLELATGTEARIEDLVVDEAVRRSGVGRGLVLAGLGMASVARARYVDLTSAPQRVAARALYQSLGFKARETGVFRHSLDWFR